VAKLKSYYADHVGEICEDCRRRLERSPLRVLDCKAEQCQAVIAGAPHFLDYLCEECAEHFRTLTGYLDLLDRRYVINHRLVRGLDYYTKTVFEVWAAGIGAQAAVCGGGRYDGLIELLGGSPTPGVGVAVGLERIILVMKDLEVNVPPLPSPRVFLAHLGLEAKWEALRLAAALRRADVAAWVSFGERGLKSQLREAGKRGVRYAVILGEDELASGTAVVRDMEAGEQVNVEMEGLLRWLKARV
jgi:histidyl-tRNA synthetase